MARLPPLTLYTEESVRALYDAMAGCWCHDIIVGHASDGALCGRHVFRKCDARVGQDPTKSRQLRAGRRLLRCCHTGRSALAHYVFYHHLGYSYVGDASSQLVPPTGSSSTFAACFATAPGVVIHTAPVSSLLFLI